MVASESAIKAAIEKIVYKYPIYKYPIWTIGVTDAPGRRKSEHGDPRSWHQWDADTETAARKVEKYFLDKGMRGGGGGTGRAAYVYIF